MKLLTIALLLWASIFTTATNAVTLDDTPVQKPLPAPSSRAQTLYTAVSDDLLQIRVLLKNGRTQSSVGSGFLIGNSNLVVTNYHVISQIVMNPETYVGEFIDTRKVSGNIKLVAVDVLHDLAVVSINRTGAGHFNVPKQLPALTQGQHLYSLGNPLDLGFAISEGTYNGIIRRGFYDQLLFTGSINAGMSGGPAITQDGQVAGVNVSKRLDGELVSFLVPVEFVRNLLAQAANQPNIDFKKTVGQQLLAHQETMINTVLAQPLSLKALGDYQVPVRESDQMRCWGQSNDNKESPYDFSSVNCAMESAIFVSNLLDIGHISIRHEYLKSISMSALRFSAFQSASFKNEQFGNDKDKARTAPMCNEHFVSNGNVPLRAVLCVRAYREFDNLYDFSLITATTNSSRISLQSRLDASGISFENGFRITTAFLNSIGQKTTSARPEAKTKTKKVQP